MKDVIRALKVQRRLAVRALKTIDSALAKVGGGGVKRRKKRQAKAKAEPKAAPVKRAPKVAQGESLADRKARKQEALRQRQPAAEGGE